MNRSAKLDPPPIPWVRQHLDRRAAEIEEVVADLVGIQTTYETTPPLALAARLPAFSGGELKTALAEGRLVWMSAMRGSKFVLPRAMVGDATAAFAGLSEEMTWRGLRSMGVTRQSVNAALPRVREVLRAAAGPIPSRVVAREAKAAGAQGALFILAARGEVVRAGRRGSYVLRSRWLPEVEPAADAGAAARRIIGLYLCAYGPVTVEDAVWWSGLPKAVVEDGLAEYGERRAGGDWQARAPLEDHAPEPDSLRVLPALDALTMAWLDRRRLVAPEDERMIYTSRASRASVLIGGRLVGSWDEAGEIRLSARFEERRAEVASEVERLRKASRG